MLKECACCKDPKDIKLFSKDSTRPSGLYVYCKPCVKIKSHERYLKNREDILKKTQAWKQENKEYYLAQQRDYKKKYSQTLDGKYVEYKGGAKGRNLKFDLTKEVFATYWQLPCHYCGDEISTIGIDRVDNDKGYVENNIVTCCELCNKSKHTMTKEEYISQCKKIAERF